MEPGTEIGAYRIIRPIGAGGMGSVWLAEHAKLRRRAAIKVLKPEYSFRTDIVTRFFNEARAATSIADPGIVQIFDFGDHDGTPYIAMELLEGEGLDERLRREGRLPVDAALRITRQVASTLGAAHAANIVHRDLKPENIFIVRDAEVAGGERAKILDFGIAKLGDQANLKTQTAVVMGTPLFMSPEQCRGAGTVDQRADVYAIGCVLFTLVTGRPPFQAEGGGEIIAKHQYEAAPRASSLAPVPPAVDDLIDRCLAKEPGARFLSGSELAVAIGEIIALTSFADWIESARAAFAASPTLIQPAAPSSAPTLQPGVSTNATTLSASATARPVGAEKRSRTPLFAGLAVAVLGGTGAAIYIATSGDTGLHDGDLAKPRASRDGELTNTTGLRDGGVQSVDAAAAPDHLEVTMQRMAAAAELFRSWAIAHAGEACPALELGELVDGWEQPMRITCTDQPADQQIGIISEGPDGKRATADDVASWQQRDVAAQLFGSRWKRTRVAEEAKKPRKPKPRPVTKATTKQPAIELDSDGVPKER